MRIYLATDHAGFNLKEELVAYVATLGHTVIDCGADTYDPNDDYPVYIQRAARAVADEMDSRAIVLGGSGQGEAIAANRFKGVRAVVYNGESHGATRAGLDEIALSREHNDANVLSLGARFVTSEEARRAVKHWLETPFSGDSRHVRRIAALDDIGTD